MARVVTVWYSWCVRNCRMGNWFKKNLYKLRLGKNSAVKEDGEVLSLRIWWSSCSLNSGMLGEVHVSWAAPNISSVLDYSTGLVLSNTCMCKDRIYTLMVLLHVSGVLCSSAARFHLPYYFFMSIFIELYYTFYFLMHWVFSHESCPGLCRCLVVRFNLWASYLSGDLTL